MKACIRELLNIYPETPVERVKQPMTQVEFDEQKTKQLEYPIRGAALGLITTPTGRIVLTQRTKPHGGWALPGGRVENEPFATAFLREAKEELGIEVKIKGLLVIENKTFISPRDEKLNFVLAIFRAECDEETLPPLTDEARIEGLNVGVFDTLTLPKGMVRRDREKIFKYL